KNYEINEIHENLTVAPGAVNKLTVSVVVNRRLNDNEKESIALVVGNAIGYDPERDQISVEGMEFESDVAKIFADEIAREQMEKRRLRNFRIAGIALATLLAIALIRMILNRRRLALEKERLSEEMLAMQQAAAAKTRDEALEAKDNGTYAKIEKYARRKPEDVAKVLKTWLMED
ncbi:MAG: flagellar M-ring protein FliF, partial [Firmicutes bacterium]|nr:flagellar M-ring protein FliF [Bacillota bacterium]